MIKYIQNLLQGAPVQWTTLGDSQVVLVENNSRKPVKSSNRTIGDVPYYGANNIQDYVNGYTHNGTYVLVAEDGTASIENYSIQWATGKFWANNHVHVLRGVGLLDSRFIYHYLHTVNFIPFLTGGGRAKLTKGKLLEIPIPIPPMAVQEEIVRILDKFTTLEAELEAELDCRKRQYEFYRDRLLSFDTLIQGGQSQNNIILKPLGDIADIGTGKSNRQDEVENGEYPFYVRSKEVLRSNTFQFDETAIIIPGEGGIGDIFHYVQGKYALHQRAYRIHLHNSRILTKFLYYYFTSEFKKYINKKSVGATATSIRKPMLERFLIPIPPIEEQARIVEILDKFDTLTTSLTEGLPLEIELRRKQYAYYRDALLSF